MGALQACAIAFVLAALCNVGFCASRKWGRVRTTCPQLDRCSCTLRTRGAQVRCFNVTSPHDIEADMAKVAGVIVKTLALKSVQITELPASWFSNSSIFDLSIKDCPLSDIGETAVARINRLRNVLITNTQLQTVPSGLSAAKGLKNLFVNWSKIKVLKGGHLMPKLTRLDLRFNSIEEVDDTFLWSFPKLLYLQLSSNKIERLSPNIFKKTKSLKIVVLGNNRIINIASHFHKILPLKRLTLGRNKLTDISELAKSTMPTLVHLDLERNSIGVLTEFASYNRRIEMLLLNHNKITRVEPRALRALKDLIHLDLCDNNISFLNASVFAADSRLEYINLSRNKLTSVIGTFKNTRQIKILNLSSNGITSISDAFAGLRSLKKLSLTENHINSIPDYSFVDNAELLEIDMAANSIQWVGRNAFRGLVTVATLRLGSNQLLSLNGSVRNLPNIKHLDASLNSIQALERSEFGGNGVLGSILLTGNNISRVEGAFTGAARLRSLGLAGNRLQTLRRADFARRMTVTPNIALRHNPLICDCRMAWLLRDDSEARIASTLTCEQPPWFKGKALRKITFKDMVMWPERCAPGCRCRCREAPGGDREITVNCSSTGLNRLPRSFPKDTTELDVQDNRIEQLDDTLMQSAPLLKVLSLRNNRLSSMNSSVLPETVRSLDLRGNRLIKLPHILVKERHFIFLWLSGNPFQCACNDYPFRQWAGAHLDVIRDVESLMCTEIPNSLVSAKKFLTLGQKDLCPAPLPPHVAYLMYALVVLVIFLALCAAYLYFERQLKAWLRSRSFFRWLRCIVVEDSDDEKLFDVFVSFSSKDASLVHGEVLPTLEALGLSYCTYERNFKGGFLLQDIIREAVACSRRTLLVLTRNFVVSEWCRLEFRLAHQRALDDSINRLVIVMVDDVPTDALDEELRHYVRAANYLCWGEPNFWKRLQRSLPKTDARRRVILQDSPHHGANDVECAEL